MTIPGQDGSETIEGTTPEQHARDAFGLPGEEPENKTGDPENPGSTQEGTGDPEKKETTSKEPGSDTSNPKYAGKYESPEALEAGYNNLFTHSQTISGENKELRGKIDELTAQIKELSKPGQPGPTPGEGGGSPSDEEDGEFWDEMNATLGSDLTSKLRAKIENSTKSIDDETAKFIEEAKMEKIYGKFLDLNPHAKDHMSEIEELQKEFQDKMANGLDPVYLISFFYDAVKGRNLPKFIDSGVLNKVKSMSKKDREKLLASSITSGDTASSPPSTNAEANFKRDVWGIV